MRKLGDPAIALTVVACSAVLLLALIFALNGNPFDHPTRTLRAQLPDITGVQASSMVKYAGAVAGTIHSVRMLTPDERKTSAHPENAIEIVIALNNGVPPLSEGLTASISSDTLLSDKFLLLSGGDPKAPALANGAVITAVAPVTFDAILRDLSNTLATMRQIFGGARGGMDGILPKMGKLLTDLDATITKASALLAGGDGLIRNANTLVEHGDGLVGNAGELVAGGRELIDTNKESVKHLLGQLSKAADTLDQLATRADKLLKDNEGNINSATKDAKAALSELKTAAASTRALVNSLRERPQQLIWGPGRTPKPPN